MFGSELKSLLAHGGLRRDIDPLAVEEYFALGYVAEPRTIFRRRASCRPRTRCCCAAASQSPSRGSTGMCASPPTPRSAGRSLRTADFERLEESVRLRMISEVPLGAFLSGGVDSSAVVAHDGRPVERAGQHLLDRLRRSGLRRVAHSHSRWPIATRPATSSTRVESDDFDLIDTLAQLYDEPYADSSAIPTYRVCQLARQHVTVALSGDGGDESFGGYRRYRLHMLEERMRSPLPLGLRRPLFGALGARLPEGRLGAARRCAPRPPSRHWRATSVEAYFHSVSILRDADARAAVQLAFRSRARRLQRASTCSGAMHANANTDDPLALIQYLDLKTYLVGDINTKVDRASMAHSLEVREPLMDHQLVEWLATLPSSLKLRGGEGKWLLKKAMEPHLPHDILYRPKMGFAVPLARWFRGPLRERVAATLLLGERWPAPACSTERYLEHLVERTSRAGATTARRCGRC